MVIEYSIKPVVVLSLIAKSLGVNLLKPFVYY